MLEASAPLCLALLCLALLRPALLRLALLGRHPPLQKPPPSCVLGAVWACEESPLQMPKRGGGGGGGAPVPT